MRRFSAIAALLIAIQSVASLAYAWGPTGHQIVGRIADGMLTPTAKAQVIAILGFTLSDAAPWLDCAKSVSGPPNHHYVINARFQKPCDVFMPGADQDTVNMLPEVKRMVDYARRNWSNCQGRPGKGCHEEYHFADVDPLDKGYSDSFYGTSTHDIVHAINAALAVLQDKPAPGPFSIRDKKEALFLLAHLVGDLHQPLHVGAVYLSPAGKELHPDKSSMSDDQKKASATAGGNWIALDDTNLHSIWDELPGNWSQAQRDKAVARGKTIPETSGHLEILALLWASDTIVESRKAFEGLKFVGAGESRWSVSTGGDGYKKVASDLAQVQIAKGGARLAQLLNTIWP